MKKNLVNFQNLSSDYIAEIQGFLKKILNKLESDDDGAVVFVHRHLLGDVPDLLRKVKVIKSSCHSFHPDIKDPDEGMHETKFWINENNLTKFKSEFDTYVKTVYKDSLTEFDPESVQSGKYEYFLKIEVLAGCLFLYLNNIQIYKSTNLQGEKPIVLKYLFDNQNRVIKADEIVGVRVDFVSCVDSYNFKNKHLKETFFPELGNKRIYFRSHVTVSRPIPAAWLKKR